MKCSTQVHHPLSDYHPLDLSLSTLGDYRQLEDYRLELSSLGD